jgi:hypothetical protein
MESQNDNIALNDLSNCPGNNDPDEIDGIQQLADHRSHHGFSLPPADRGKDAWLCLAAGFVVEALVWGKFKLLSFGSVSSIEPLLNPLTLPSDSTSCIDIFTGFPFSFGVFQEYYTTHEPFSSQPAGIAAVGTTATVRKFTFPSTLFMLT